MYIYLLCLLIIIFLFWNIVGRISQRNMYIYDMIRHSTCTTRVFCQTIFLDFHSGLKWINQQNLILNLFKLYTNYTEEIFNYESKIIICCFKKKNICYFWTVLGVKVFFDETRCMCKHLSYVYYVQVRVGILLYNC